MKIKALGIYGGREGKRALSCFQLNERILFDAGNIFSNLETPPEAIDHIFLTHSHLDHVVEIPFLVDKVFSSREYPIKIYAGKETIEALKQHIMNDKIWPDFSNLRLPKSGLPAVEYVEISEGKEVELFEYQIIPFASVHTVETYGFVIREGNKGLVYSGDTYTNPDLWKLVNENEYIKAVIVDVSFPSSFKKIAEASKHYTPELLKKDVESYLKRNDIELYVYHFKPRFFSSILKELKTLNCKILEDGMEIVINGGQK